VRFFADSPVDEVIEENSAVTVKTARGTIRAGHAVIATIVDRVALHSKFRPTGHTSLVLRSTKARFRMRSTETPKSLTIMPVSSPVRTARILFWLAAKIIRAAKQMMATSVLIGLEPGPAAKCQCYRTLHTAGRDRCLIPLIMPVIGRNPGSEYIYVATGDSGQGRD